MSRPKTRRLAEDDLLRGFDQTGPSRGKLGGFFGVTIGASLFAWNVMFNLGAYHEVFYRSRQQLFVVSLVVLLGGLAMRRRARMNSWLLILFTPPVLLVLLQLAVPVNHSGTAVRMVYHAMIILMLAVLPVVVWVVARLAAPQYFILPDRRAKIAVIGIVAVVALIGYAVGRFNDRFLTCEDFQVAGDAQPKGCVHVKHR